MRKILSVLLAVVLVVTLSFSASMIASAGESDPTIVVSSGTTNQGGTKDVTISIKNNPGIASIKLKVAFPSDLSLVSFGNDTYDGKYTDANGDPDVEATNVTDWVKYDVVGSKGGFVFQPENANSPVTLIWVSPTANVTGDFTFATLKFKVADNAELGDKDITVTYDPEDVFKLVDGVPSEQNVAFEVQNGKITVTDILRGDVDGNGKVNPLDVTYLRRYLAKWDEYELGGKINAANADVDGNGKINPLDVTYLRRYLAHWDGYEDLNNLPH